MIIELFNVITRKNIYEIIINSGKVDFGHFGDDFVVGVRVRVAIQISLVVEVFVSWLDVGYQLLQL